MGVTSIAATISAAVPASSSVETLTAIAVTPSAPFVQMLLGVVRDLIVTGAAGVGAYVALRGLGAWRSQLRGQSEYTLAKRILMLLQKYRDALRATRHPWMEYTLPEDAECQDLSREQRQYRGLQQAYEDRWGRVKDVRAELYPELLEARVLWGDTIDETLRPVFQLERDLLFAIRDELKVLNPDVSPYEKEDLETADSRRARRARLYDGLDEDDEFSKQTDTVVDQVSAFLGPMLGKRRDA